MKRTTILLAVLCFFAITFGRPAASQTAKPFDITGKWTATIHTTDKTVTETWDITHDGNKLMGKAKTQTGEGALSGTIDGNIVRALVREGAQNHQVHLTVDGDDMDGTIRMGKN